MSPRSLKKRVALTPVVVAPFYDPTVHGITQGILGRFKTCREATRNTLQGWTGKHPSFPLVYGSLTHYVLERAYARVVESDDRSVPKEKEVETWLDDAKVIWDRENPIRSDISVQMFERSMAECAGIMPVYFRHWKTDFTSRTWVHLEREFTLPWTVPLADGRVVNTFLRGKMDGVFKTPRATHRPGAYRLFESKTRTQINEDQLIETMPFNLQTSVYLIALSRLHNQTPAEVEMNIIRKTSLRQGKTEDWASLQRRIVADVRARPDWYFVRMSMTVDTADIRTMEGEISALITDFLSWWYGLVPHYRNDDACYQYHRPCDYLHKCSRGDTSQLFQRKTVYSELQEERV